MMLKIKQIILIAIVLLLGACEEKSKPIIIKNPNAQIPISCMKLDSLEKNELINQLETLYNFTPNCNYTLSLKFKKDIVCNSTQNVGMKSMGKFPQSFLQLEVREGLKPIYSYYIDLYHNANIDDVKIGFMRLNKDILKK